jgi:hypothetical protein
VPNTFEALGGLHASLARVLRELEAQGGSSERLGSAVAAWQSALDEVGSWQQLADTVEADEQPRLRAELERLRSLHAIVTDAAMRGRSETSRSLERVLVIRKAMHNHRAPGETGASCDLSG